MTGHLRPTATIAADVLLPSDPGAALALAQELLEKPLMANHSHGLWGYSGRTHGGSSLTIQSTGIGGPSAAAVIAELHAHGCRRAIRVGRATALDPALGAGDLVLVSRALAADGTSQALDVDAPRADRSLTAALGLALGTGTGAPAHPLTVASSDLFHDPAAAPRRAAWLSAGAAVADLESAAVLALGMRLSMPVACALVVFESASGQHDEPAVQRGLSTLASAAAAAFTATAVDPVQASDSGTASLL